MNIGKRLSEQRKDAGFTRQEALGNALGVSFNTISRWEKEETPIPSDKLLAMGELGLDVVYIITGKPATSPVPENGVHKKQYVTDTKKEKTGDVAASSPKSMSGDGKTADAGGFEKSKPLKNNKLEKIDSQKTASVGGFPRLKTTDELSLAEGMSVYSVSEDELAPRGVSKPPELEGYVFIPVLDIEASSGDGRLALSENVTEYVPFSIIELRKNNLNPKYLVGAHNKGDSMAPTLPERGLFVYDESKTRVDGGIFFFLYHDEFYIKRLTREGDSLRVISDNPAYPAWVIEDVENCHVIGKKVWHERWGG